MTSPSKGASNPLLAAAEAYAARGWSVFPLKEREKAPITARGFLDASTDRNQVLEWWQLFPDANIGLATGRQFDVLDIDSPDAVSSVQEILGTHYRHEGPVASTGKGWHLYFAAESGARNRAGLMGGHVDYRGDGGYVVGPPSVHPSGRHYVWADGRSFKSPLPRLPESLRSLIVKPATRPQAERIVIANGSDILRQNTAARYAATRPDILATVELLGGIVRHHGAHYATNCFFHDDPGPSMVLYTHDNSFHCYGCEAHGDSDNLRMGKDMTGRRFI